MTKKQPELKKNIQKRLKKMDDVEEVKMIRIEMHVGGELKTFWMTLQNKEVQEKIEKAISKELAKHD